MAIDTAEKLLSILDGDPTTMPGIPFPFTAFGVGEKLHVLWLYSGLFDGPDEPAAVDVDNIPVPIHRFLVRTANIEFEQLGEISVDDLKLTIKRGIGTVTTEPVVQVRVRRDNGRWSKWVKKGLGVKGDRMTTLLFGGFGHGLIWQFEIMAFAECEVELCDLEILPTRVGH